MVMKDIETEGTFKKLFSGDWFKYTLPFPHFHIKDVFQNQFYSELAIEYEKILQSGLSDIPDRNKLSKNMPNSDAYGWNFPPDIEGVLSFFYSKRWHKILSTLVDFPLTYDVNAALHYHQPFSQNGQIHSDLGLCWFSQQPRADGINPMDLDRCSYVGESRANKSDSIYKRTRAITMIFFLGNDDISMHNGGETGLYKYNDISVLNPQKKILPLNNSMLIFENSPFSFHSFIGNGYYPRKSIILWLHQDYSLAKQKWGDRNIISWNSHQ